MNTALRSLARRLPCKSPTPVTPRNFHAGYPKATHLLRKVELTPLEQRKLTFESDAVVTELENSGFEKNQAEILVSALVTLTTVNMDIVYKDMVTSSHQEVGLQQTMAQLDSIRKDMLILEKSEFANLRSANEEESKRVRAEARLDINLERSLISDMLKEQDKTLLQANAEFHKKKAEIDCDNMETKKKIDLDVASLKTLLESMKQETIRYLTATVFAVLAITSSVYQLWM
ncbi:hypothetical protein CRUP_017639 [Coryphaenoides rupestris]|nr:hypothetical protein CRUP_017639 [Coryphaenoides rupestris]